MTVPLVKLTKGYVGKCANGHDHTAKPQPVEERPTVCRHPKCEAPLEWKAVKR